MKKTIFIPLLLSFFLILRMNNSVAGTICDDDFKSVEQMVYSNNFTVDRGLDRYKKTFGDFFSSTLSNLKSTQTWVDFGAGEAKALLQYQSAAKGLGAKTIAVGVTRPDKSDEIVALEESISQSDNFSYLAGRFVEKIDDSEFGIIDIGTDYYGAASYTHQPTELFNKYLRLLKKDEGQLFVLFSISGYEDPISHQFIRTETKVINIEGKEVPFHDWLSMQKGIEVIISTIKEHQVMLKIRRTGDNVNLPHLVLETIQEGTPPFRVFRERP
ncbi:MAG: hypothetical protein ACOYL6_19230 [Bacteriovoracaceae bacterium]